MSDQENKGKFTLINKINFEDLRSGKSSEVKESDLCFQDDMTIFQFKYEKPDKEQKIIVEPGTFTFINTNIGINIGKTELRTNNLLTSINNAKSIIKEADTFFDNLDVYKELEEPMARKILLYSDPGMGKSATIAQYCTHATQVDPGSAILVWPTSSVDSDDLLEFLSTKCEYDPKVTRQILIMEDIGGNEKEGSHAARTVDSGLLNILDGIQMVFRVPTFIIATTNYPQNLLSALADRPGRFDLILPLNPPSPQERVQLAEWISKRSLSDEDKSALTSSVCNDFSIAHIKEIIVRSRIHKRSISSVIDEILAHKKLFEKAFEDSADGGFGFGRMR